MKLKKPNINISASKLEVLSSEFYKNGKEYLADEFLKIDALIHLQVLKLKSSNSRDKFNEFSGFYIAKEEIDKMLGREPGTQERPNINSEKSEIKKVLNYIKKLKTKLREKVEHSLKSGIYLPLYQLSCFFHLTSFELDIILICLAPEVDIKYEKLYAYLHDDITKKNPSVQLIMDILCNTIEERNNARVYFPPQSPLIHYHLIRVDEDSQQKSFLSRYLQIDDRIVNFLLEYNIVDSHIFSFTKKINPRRKWSEVLIDNSLKEKLIQFSKKHVQNDTRDKAIFYFCGPPGVGKKFTAEAFCENLKLPLVIVDIRDLFNSASGFEELIQMLFREAILQPAAIYLEHFD